jgi:hypothetical protein
MLKEPMVRASVLGVVLLGAAVAMYLLSPLFISNASYLSFPTLGMMPSRTARPATATPDPTETPVSSPTIQDDEAIFESSSSLLIWQADFYAVAHPGRGSANVYMMEDGSLIVRLEDFEVEDGPELHVYLTDQDPVQNTEGIELTNAIDLGELRGLIGDQSYLVPSGLDLSQYLSVVIWCEPYLIPFIAAPVQLQ